MMKKRKSFAGLKVSLAAAALTAALTFGAGSVYAVDLPQEGGSESTVTVTPTPEVTPESADSNTGQDEKTQTVYRYVIYILAGLIAVTLVVTIVSGIRKHMKKKKRRKKS